MPPSEYSRKASRIDKPWQAFRYITEAGNALPATHTADFKLAAHLTTLAILRAMQHVG